MLPNPHSSTLPHPKSNEMGTGRGPGAVGGWTAQKLLKEHEARTSDRSGAKIIGSKAVPGSGVTGSGLDAQAHTHTSGGNVAHQHHASVSGNGISSGRKPITHIGRIEPKRTERHAPEPLMNLHNDSSTGALPAVSGASPSLNVNNTNNNHDSAGSGTVEPVFIPGINSRHHERPPAIMTSPTYSQYA